MLQIAGSKHWKIYHSPLALPHRTQPSKASEIKLTDPLYELELKAGDLIYLPRGYIHEALSSDNQSLHLTIGILANTWMELFTEVLATCKNEESFRPSLPLGFAHDGYDKTLLRQQYKQLLQILGDEAKFEAALEKLTERFFLGRIPILDGQLTALADSNNLQMESIVRQRPGLIYQLRLEGEQIAILFSRKKLKFPKYVEKAVSYIVETPEFTISAIPGKLDEAGKLVLVRRLIKEGFLTLKNDE